MEEVRLDQWLCATRIFKSRTLAQKSCGAGHVAVNGFAAKSSRTVRVGDMIRLHAPRGLMIVVVRAVHDKRLSAPLARDLYDDQSPPSNTEDKRVAVRPRGAGRPTKAERRSLARLRQGVDLE
jgi:ribosome-associated heat shock protein Hsp15